MDFLPEIYKNDHDSSYKSSELVSINIDTPHRQITMLTLIKILGIIFTLAAR